LVQRRGQRYHARGVEPWATLSAEKLGEFNDAESRVRPVSGSSRLGACEYVESIDEGERRESPEEDVEWELDV
jgi:hypothetical protein